jgi:hypothetical protein
MRALTCGAAGEIEPLTPCMPCSFGLLQHARSEADDDLTGLVVVTVVDRYIPLVTAAYGTTSTDDLTHGRTIGSTP